MDCSQPPAKGRTFETLVPGCRFSTSARTITETDLINFITMFGFNEPLFVDARAAHAAGYSGRLVPGALTYCMAEGLILQSNIIHGTGIAFLGMDLDVKNPVYVGDTIHADWEVTHARRASSGSRGVITARVSVRNQHDVEVLAYTPLRLISAAGNQP
jgi:acyl dehydratase